MQPLKLPATRTDPVTITTTSIKETHTHNDPANSNTENASAVVPTDDESRIHLLLERASCRGLSKDQSDLVTSLSNAENQELIVTCPRQNRKAP